MSRENGYYESGLEADKERVQAARVVVSAKLLLTVCSIAGSVWTASSTYSHIDYRIRSSEKEIHSLKESLGLIREAQKRRERDSYVIETLVKAIERLEKRLENP